MEAVALFGTITVIVRRKGCDAAATAAAHDAGCYEKSSQAATAESVSRAGFIFRQTLDGTLSAVTGVTGGGARRAS